VEEHQGMSDLWSEPDQTVAREVLQELLEIIITQERLTQSTKNMEAFSYAAAHDLRTPLRHIRAVLNMLREAHEYNTPTNTSTPSQTANPAQIADSPPTAIDGTDEVSNLLDIGLKSTDRLQRLVDNMMRFLVLNERDHESELISLTEVVKEAVDSLGDMIKSANAILNIDKHLPTVQGNQELITSVFTNLLENAIKYRDPSRPLTITIGTETRSGKTAIKISDNGIGIPQDQAKAVFEPFKRLHTHDQIAGSGLGLSICKRIIELHRATLEINPEHHPGTEFVLTLRTS
jgi:signal transduction histidine kinase